MCVAVVIATRLSVPQHNQYATWMLQNQLIILGLDSLDVFNVGKKRKISDISIFSRCCYHHYSFIVYMSLSNCSVLVSLGHLVMDLNHMLRPAKSPEKCTLQVLDQPPDKLVSLFEQKTVKGWWPCTCENNGEKIIAVRAQTHTQPFSTGCENI